MKAAFSALASHCLHLPLQELNLLAPLPHILPFLDARNALARGTLALTTCPQEPRAEAFLKVLEANMWP